MLVYCKTNNRGSEIKNNCQILVKGKQKIGIWVTEAKDGKEWFGDSVNPLFP